MSTYATSINQIPAGGVFLLTEGAYSSFGIIGMFRARQEIDLDALLGEFKELWRRANPSDHGVPRIDAYRAWLERHDALERVDYFEWLLGDYGRVEQHAWDQSE